MNVQSITQFVRKFAQILAALALVFTIAMSQVGSVHAQSVDYPLAGEKGNPSAPEYDVVWEKSGRLWQYDQPIKEMREEFTVAFRIESGVTYEFNGTEAELHLDETRNGKGLSNPMTVGYGNGLKFTVRTADGKPAWAVVYGRGNESGGFDIWAVSPTFTGSDIASDSDTPAFVPVMPMNQPDSTIFFTMPHFGMFNFVTWSLLGGWIFFALLALVTLFMWIHTTILMWKISWFWGLCALISGWFLPIIAPIVWYILLRAVTKWPTKLSVA